MDSAEEKRAELCKRARDAYRRKHGIPLDAPVSKTGPKRGSTYDKSKLPRVKYYWET